LLRRNDGRLNRAGIVKQSVQAGLAKALAPFVDNGTDMRVMSMISYIVFFSKKSGITSAR